MEVARDGDGTEQAKGWHDLPNEVKEMIFAAVFPPHVVVDRKHNAIFIQCKLGSIFKVSKDFNYFAPAAYAERFHRIRFEGGRYNYHRVLLLSQGAIATNLRRLEISLRNKTIFAPERAYIRIEPSSRSAKKHLSIKKISIREPEEEVPFRTVPSDGRKKRIFPMVKEVKITIEAASVHKKAIVHSLHAFLGCEVRYQITPTRFIGLVLRNCDPKVHEPQLLAWED